MADITMSSPLVKPRLGLAGATMNAMARIELVVQDAEAEKIVAAIQKAAFTGQIGDGKIFVHPVDNAVRVRTSERGEAAIK